MPVGDSTVPTPSFVSVGVGLRAAVLALVCTPISSRTLNMLDFLRPQRRIRQCVALHYTRGAQTPLRDAQRRGRGGEKMQPSVAILAGKLGQRI